MSVTVVDYGVGNIFSVCEALRNVGVDPEVDSDGSKIGKTLITILPGVAAFSAGITELRRRGQAEALLRAHELERPIVGLCLGAQMLFPYSDESPGVPGLAIIPGKVGALPATHGRVPRQGWFRVSARPENAAMAQMEGIFYFSHGFEMVPTDASIVQAESRHGSRPMCAVFKQGAVTGIQFHPELSGPAGLALLRSVTRTDRI